MTPNPRIAELEARLAAREGKPGYKLNCVEIRAELARLRAQEAVRADR